MDIIRTLYYIQGTLNDEIIFCCFICVTLLWVLHIVIKQEFFYINIRNDVICFIVNMYYAVLTYKHRNRKRAFCILRCSFTPSFALQVT